MPVNSILLVLLPLSCRCVALKQLMGNCAIRWSLSNMVNTLWYKCTMPYLQFQNLKFRVPISVDHRFLILINGL